MCEKHLWLSDILNKIATLPQVFFTHFASKNQLPDFSINRTFGWKWVNITMQYQITQLSLQ